jgi:hypothetical protein
VCWCSWLLVRVELYAGRNIRLGVHNLAATLPADCDEPERRVQQTLRVPPAMEAGIAGYVWSIEEVVSLLDSQQAKSAAWNLIAC